MKLMSNKNVKVDLRIKDFLNNLGKRLLNSDK